MAKKVLSQAEKREVYVREGWVGAYNLARLMAWHESQEKAGKPDEATWRRLFHDSGFGLRQQIQKVLDQSGLAGIVLDDVASSCTGESLIVAGFLHMLDEPLKWFAFHLDWAYMKAIPIEPSRLALVDARPPHEIRVLHEDEEDGTVEVGMLSESDMFDAAMQSWTEGVFEREQARRWLCGCLWSAIMALHDQADVEFDASVAVSDDGMRVLTADQVVVYRYDGKRLEFRSYQNVAFLLHKIRLGQPHAIRRPELKRKQTEERVVQSVLKPREVKRIVQETLKLKRTQALLQVGKLRILFIEQGQVPDGLRPAVCSTTPAPPSTPTMPSPGNETASSTP